MRYACGVEYDGEPFFGFQIQTQEPTVQSCLEKAISQVANHPVKLICSGRTDTGVSARHQVIHFDSDASRSERQWTLGINTAIHRGIVVLWVRAVPDEFHARFSATSRSYEYTILNRAVKPAINRHHLTWVLQPLEHAAMHEAVQVLLGTHDFSAFRSSQCQSHEPVKTLQHAEVVREGEKVILRVTANGFLHHMIRNIIGTLIPIGKGEKPISWIKAVLESRDRRQAGVTAPPNGLVFANVCYPEYFGLPEDVSS